MIIKVLECNPDGTQALEDREVPDDYFVISEAKETEPHGPTEMELAQQDITSFELADIEKGQEITDLELMMLGGSEHV